MIACGSIRDVRSATRNVEPHWCAGDNRVDLTLSHSAILFCDPKQPPFGGDEWTYEV